MRLTLETKMMAILFLVTTLTLGIVGFTHYQLSKNKLYQQLEEQTLDTLSNAADNLDAYLKVRTAEAEIISRTTVIRSGTLPEKLAYLAKELEQGLERHYLSIGIADLQGNLTLSDGEQGSLAHTAAFATALQGKSAVSDPYIGQMTNTSVISILVPVFNEERHVTGVLSVALDARSVFSSQLNLDDPAKQRRIIVVNMESTVLYNTDSSKNFVLNYRRDFPAFTDQYDIVSEQDRGSIQTVISFGPSKSFFVRMPLTNWIVLLSVGLSNFEAPLRSLLYTTLLIIAAAELCLFLIIRLTVNRFIIRRLKPILKATESVADGNFYTSPLDHSSSDELGQLSQSVNGMIQNLRSLFEPFEAFIRENKYAMIVTDAAYKITYFNRQAEQLLGYSAIDVIHKKTPHIWLDPQQLAERAALYAQELQEPIPADCTAFFIKAARKMTMDTEWLWLHRVGARIPVNVNVSTMIGAKGKVKGFVLIAQDIRGYKETLESRNRLLNIMENAHDFIASFDKRGDMFYINQAGLQLLGIEKLDEDTCNIGNYLVGEMAFRLSKGVRNAEERGFWEEEIEFRTARGERIVTSQTLVAHTSTDGRETYYSTIVRDIREQKRIQRAILEAKEEADEANRSKSLFLARMSHEIRTPLNGIMGLSHLMQRSELSDIQADYMHKIVASSQSLLGIINDILDFSKIEADKLDIERISFSLGGIVKRLNGTLSVLIGHKPVELVADIGHEVPDELAGDPLRLEQVLLNLLSNAVKFTSQGQIEFGISLHRANAASIWLDFSVKDTGVGMNAAQLEHLFEPFVQADGSTSRKYGGTGLGLVIAKSLIERMGGELRVRSLEGQGSEFGFRLPFPVIPGQGAEAGKFPYQALVAKDHPATCRLWQGALASITGEAYGVLTWKDALRRIVEAPPDIAFLDMESADMYGEETWFELKREADRQGVLTVACTTLAGRDALLLVPEQLRPDWIMVKPFSRYELADVLSVVRDKRRQTAPEAAQLEQVYGETQAGHILLVEDNRINQTVAREILVSHGLQVTVAGDGFEALQRLEEARFDLVLMDLHMPGLDGIETTKRIRTDAAFVRLPIIALTADATKEQREACLKAEMNEVLTKPVQPEKLIRTVAQWLPSAQPLTAASKEITDADLSDAGTGGWSFEGPLDTKRALAFLGGREQMYIQLLDAFLLEYGRIGDKLSLTDPADRHDAHRIVHSLRGAAGNLGAKDVFLTAGALEEALQTGIGALPELTVRLKDQLEQLTQAIRELPFRQKDT
ncbi:MULTISPECIES: response regulator [Paenibacillus]|uniref:Circadian input-output histidine kinase CikA n=1 Tax=Paenibacillus validus TaxID=44253 RepID=A0A7X2ZFX6_9BACL|nr:MULTISPECIES: response regulator [Paenibacillus]MUG73426.1 response regulator [Paenibacillus validus]